MIRAARGLIIELTYTRDERVDHSDGGWSSFPEEPGGEGWILCKSGWLRVWTRRGQGLNLHTEAGNA